MSVTPTTIGFNTQTTSATSIVASSVTAGVGDVIWAAVENINKSVSSVTDSASNTYTKVGEITVGSNTLLSVWRCKVTSALSAGSVTADWTAAGNSSRSSITISRVASGLLASEVEDQVPTATTNTGTAISIGPTGTLAQADELVMVWVGENANNSGDTISWGGVSGGTGLTQLDVERADSGTSFHDLFVAYGESAATTALTLSGTLSTSPKHWVCVAATYKVAAAGTAYTDSGTLSLTLSISGSDSLASTDSGSLPVTVAISGSDSLASVDAGTLPLTIAITGTETYTPGGAYVDSGTLTLSLSLTGTDALASVDAGTLAFTLAITGTDTYTPAAAYIPPSGTPWEVYLCDRFGYPIQNISRVCFAKQYTATLNRPAQFTFWTPSNDSRIGGLHTDGNPYLMEGRAIRVYRAGTLVFAGHLWQVEDDGDSETEKTSVTCFDPLQWLTRRVARRMVYVSLTIGSPSINLYVSLFTNKDDDVYTFQSTNSHSSTETARGLLNAANDYDGFTGLDDYYQSSIYRPNVATPSSVTNQSAPTSGSVNIAFANSRVSDVLLALVGQSGNFDLEVVPTDADYYSSATAGPFHGGSRSATYQQAYKYGWAGDYDSIRGSLLTRPWKTLALLRYWAPTKGSQQDSVIFGYDTYPHNIASISRLVDLQNLTNNSVMLGSQNWAREVNVTSVQTYGAGMDVQGLSDITDPVLLDALAAEEVQLGGNAKQTVQITPLAGARTPLPFDDFVLGDQVHVNAGSRLRGGFTGLQRVYGFTLDISDDTYVETLTSLIASPQTG